MTSIDSIATIGVNLSSNSEIVSQITTIRYANFLITENKETLIERYNTLYTTLQLFKREYESFSVNSYQAVGLLW